MPQTSEALREQERAVFFKQSGERLTSKDSIDRWTPAGVRATGEKIARTYRVREELGITGFTVVSGAGNIARGDELKKFGIGGEQADFMGRLSLVMNTIVVYQDLCRLRIPAVVLLTEKMKIEDRAADHETYSATRMREAHADGQVVLIAGGTGEDNVTTDNAVVHYANEYRSVEPDQHLLILKGTKHDGVFAHDPEKYTDAKRFSIISAQTMLDDYEKYPVVDRPSLESLVANNLSMRVYADGAHDLESVLRHDPRDGSNGNSIGSLIVPYELEPAVA
jgi:uridylate kinase